MEYWNFPSSFDVIVIGAGHAGCEAAHASAKMGCKTLLLTMNLDTIGKMSCNPSIGGTAKGHIVREIDALGGLMGKICDKSAIHYRLLNASKGPAIHSPRAQCDKWYYSLFMKQALEETSNLHIFQASVEQLIHEQDHITGVKTKEGFVFHAPQIIVCSGTFMRGLLHVGQTNYEGGRAGDKAASGISGSLQSLGFNLERLKTGTPARVHAKSICFDELEVQPSQENVRFSYDSPEAKLGRVHCYISYTNKQTQQIIEENLHRSPLYGGRIKGVGPRYCPSIEDKIVRFSDKERHQVFIEPEGLFTHEIYLNGVSTSLPFDVQYAMLRTIPGLENVQILRYGYAIEYDYAVAGQINASLETKNTGGLFFAGQINGTTGYEEAAAQGLIAGINAALRHLGKASFIPSRSESYIGVMLDDLVTKNHTEPYRMFTSRAEYRLLLRQDNADLRLRHYGHEFGLIDHKQFEALEKKRTAISSNCEMLKGKRIQLEGKSITLAQLLARPQVQYCDLKESYDLPELENEIATQIGIELKYAGYIQREREQVKKLKEMESLVIPQDFNFDSLKHMRAEAKEKLKQFKPQTLAQAGQIQGVNPSDLQLLMIAIREYKNSLPK